MMSTSACVRDHAPSPAFPRGGLYKKIASAIFLNGNVALWLTGAINFDSEWNKLVGSSMFIGVNAFYFFGNNKPKWNNFGHILSIIGMVFVNLSGLVALGGGAIWGMVIYTASRGLGVYASHPASEQHEGSSKAWVKYISSKAPQLMTILGILSRFSMMASAMVAHDVVLSLVLFAWNIGDVFLGLGPQRSTSKRALPEMPVALDEQAVPSFIQPVRLIGAICSEAFLRSLREKEASSRSPTQH